jgi:hypothetical protein
VALHAHNGDEDPIGGGGAVKVTDLGSEHQLVRDGVEQLAHGALVCPHCSMPVRISAAVRVGASLDCAYCAARGPAREFLVRDVFDTAANEVLLIARIEAATG